MIAVAQGAKRLILGNRDILYIARLRQLHGQYHVFFEADVNPFVYHAPKRQKLKDALTKRLQSKKPCSETPRLLIYIGAYFPR
jgi:recombinational DNA repair protein RecR